MNITSLYLTDTNVIGQPRNNWNRCCQNRHFLGEHLQRLQQQLKTYHKTITQTLTYIKDPSLNQSSTGHTCRQ